jgi:hypothetical protein
MKSELLALAFGMLIILITFGDAHLESQVGNLDTIFGLTFWKALDVVYPVASLVVFLLYGRQKNSLRVTLRTAVIFLSYLAVLSLICLDDVAIALNLPVNPPVQYWIVMEWGYPIYAIVAFFLFGRTNRTEQQSLVT